MRGRCIFYLLPVIFCLLCVSGFSQLQGNSGFLRRYQGNVPSSGISLVALPNGDFLLAGFKGYSDFTGIINIIRTDSLGRIIWTKDYQGLLTDYDYVGGAYNTEGPDMVLTTDNNVLICSPVVVKHTFPHISFTGDGTWLLKIDYNGNIIWSNSYLIDNDGTNSAPVMEPGSITRDPKGGFLIAGVVNSGFYDMITKVNDSGKVLWSKSYQSKSGNSNGPGNFPGIIPSIRGGYLIGGGISYSASKSGTYYQVMKTDSNGKIEWDVNYGTSNNENIYSILEMPDKSIYVFGYNYTSSYNSTIQKLDSSGHILWSKKYSLNSTDINFGLAIYDYKDKIFDIPVYSDLGTGLIRIDTSGKVILKKIFQSYPYPYYLSTTHNFIQLPSGGFGLLSNYASQKQGGGPEDLFFIKTDKNFNTGPQKCLDTSATVGIANYEISYNAYNSMVSVNENVIVVDTNLKVSQGNFNNIILCPPFLVNFNKTYLCTGSEIQFLDSSYYDPISWNWNFGDGSASTVQNPVHQYNASGTYKVTLTASNGTDTASATKTIVVKLLNNLFSTDTFICAADSIVLNAQNPGATYSWNTGNSSQIQPVDTGTYWVKISKGICFQADTFHVKPLVNPKIYLGHDTTICTGDTLTLNAGYAATTWSTGATASDIRVVNAGTYWATLKGKTCLATDTVKVKRISLNANLGSFHTTCSDSLQLGPVQDSGAAVIWSTGDTTSTITVDKSGNYWVSVKTKQCQVSDTTFVDIAAFKGKNTLPKDTFLCQGTVLPVDLINRGASKALWSDSVNGLRRTIIKPGLYIVTLFTTGCKETDSMQVSYDTTHFKIATFLCQGAPFLLYGPSWKGVNFDWSTGSKNNIVTVTKPGTYWLSIQHGVCTVSDTVSVKLDSPIVVNLGGNHSLCDTAFKLFAGNDSDAVYLWSTGDTSRQISIDRSGKYWVKILNTDGCSASDTAFITLNIPIHFLGDNLEDILFCNDTGTLILDAGEAYSYLWSPGGDTIRYKNISDSGTYQVQITGANGCTAEKTAHVSVDCTPHLYIPNAFSPDSGKPNKIFKAVGVNIASFSMSVYNRWGEKIFSTDNINNGWDGTFKNELCKSEVYLYIINYKTDETPTQNIRKSGNVFLIR